MKKSFAKKIRFAALAACASALLLGAVACGGDDSDATQLTERLGLHDDCPNPRDTAARTGRGRGDGEPVIFQLGQRLRRRLSFFGCGSSRIPIHERRGPSA